MTQITLWGKGHQSTVLVLLTIYTDELLLSLYTVDTTEQILISGVARNLCTGVLNYN